MTKEVDNRLWGSGRQAGRGQLPGRTAPLEMAVSRGPSQLPVLSHSVECARQMLQLNLPLSENFSRFPPFRLFTGGNGEFRRGRVFQSLSSPCEVSQRVPVTEASTQCRTRVDSALQDTVLGRGV